MSKKRLIGAFAFLAGAFVLCSCSSGGGSETPPTPVIVDINGGVAGSAAVGSIFVIDGSGFGTPTATSSGYFVAFRDSSTNGVVANATVDLSTSGNWTDVFVKATVPNQLVAGTTYKVTVTTPGGTSNALNFLIAASVSFSPSTILWSSSYALPVAVQGLATAAGAVGTSTYVYAMGGNTAVSGSANGDQANIDSVYLNKVNITDGTLVDTTWSALTALPGKRGFAAAVFANSYNSLISGGALYVLGGLDDTGAATSTVYYALLRSADGTIPASGSGTWATTTALPEPLSALAAVVFHGRIYIAGGNASNGSPVMKVYAAAINSNGTLGAWSALADLPAALAYHQMVEIAGTLYVMGGDTAAADPISNVESASDQDTVYYDPIDITTGAIGSAWTTNSGKLNKAREKFSATGAGGYILVSCGIYGGSAGSSEESYAAVNTDGSLASFNGATGSHTISNLSGYVPYNHGHCYVVDSSGNPHVLILGGADVTTGTLHAEVWYQH